MTKFLYCEKLAIGLAARQQFLFCQSVQSVVRYYTSFYPARVRVIVWSKLMKEDCIITTFDIL